jgi:hypothetical protein
MPSLSSEQRSGYLVLADPRVVVRSFEAEVAKSADADAWRAFLAQLRAAFPALLPERYRGLSRTPLDRSWDGEDRMPGAGPNWAARVMIRERLGPDPNLTHRLENFDPDLLPDLPFAREVLAATDCPGEWEIARVRRNAQQRARRTLGFDVGYWGSDHYSLICDSLLMPKWHVPDPETFALLRVHAARLNEHLLFDGSEDAHAFRAWYVTQAWAEAEMYPAEFQVIRVDDVGADPAATSPHA